MEAIHETIAREELVCRGCGRPKDVGLVVCWDCFKRHPSGNCLKYAGLSLNAWLRSIGRGEHTISDRQSA